jgi:transcriptional regulator with XRE-family HTH domain
LTQEEASTAAGLDTRAWQRLEAGEVNPTLFTLHRVAIVLGATLPEVVTQLGPEANPRRPGRPRRRS